MKKVHIKMKHSAHQMNDKEQLYATLKGCEEKGTLMLLLGTELVLFL